MRRLLSAFIVTAILLAGAGPTYAQTRSSGRITLWATAGAGAGFGLGLFVGLHAFDDAVNSDRKVWTSAIIGAAAGGTLGFLVGRSRRPASTPTASAKLSEREVRSLAQSVRLPAPRPDSSAVLQSPDADSTAGQF